VILPRIGWILLLAAFSAQQLSPVAGQSSDEIPRDSVPQHSPCTDQPKSLKDLAQSFNKGRVPPAHDVTGTWVAIGFLGHYVSLSCAGVKRGKKFEWVMLTNGYSVEIDMIGSYSQTTTFKPDGKGNLALAVDFEGDDIPVYRCRLTQRKTIACLVGTPPFEDGVEFKKVPVEENEIFKGSP
jgi:hypothetical protein